MRTLNPSTTLRARLEITGPDGRRSVELDGEPKELGRSPHAQVQLRDGAISRRHALVVSDGQGRWLLRDLGSRNGTTVNGAPMRGEHRLQSGDAVRIGPFVLRLHEAARSDRSPTSPNTSVITMSDSEVGHVQGLEEFPPARINTIHHDMLTELGIRLAAENDDGRCCRDLCELLVHPEFRGRTALVLRVPDEGVSAPVLVGERVSSERWRDDPPHVSRTLLRAALKAGGAVMASGVPNSGGGAINVGESIDVRQMAAIACPLSLSDARHGVLYVTLPADHGTGEWLALVSLAAKQYELAQSNRRVRGHDIREAAMEIELEKAREVQRRLLPTPEQIAGVKEMELAVSFEPCRAVGGDYVDVIGLPDGRMLFVIADVSGKGLPAALVSSTLHAMSHATARAGMSLADMMAALNEHLCAYLDNGMFVTAAAVVIDPRTGALETINAGHPPALILGGRSGGRSGGGDGSSGSDGNVRELPPSLNCILGIPQPTLRSSHDCLGPGELLVLYTDGLTEIVDADGTLLGPERLGQEIRTLREASPKDHPTGLAQRLRDRLNELEPHDEAADDRTFLLARRTGVTGNLA